MQLAPEAFDPATVAMMGRVCDGVWDEATNRLSLFSARDSTRSAQYPRFARYGSRCQWRARYGSAPVDGLGRA